MSAPPWMPLYIADYLADTGHLSTVEHGSYLLLIMHYWQNGGLPDDDVKLARICRLSVKAWSPIKPTISSLFQEGWRHKRIDIELAKAEETINKRSAAGKAGASARYGNRIADAEQSNIPRARASPSPSPSEEKTNTLSAAPTARVQDEFELTGDQPEPKANGHGNGHDYGDEFEDLWREYRVIGSPNSSKADAFKRWSKLSADDKSACWRGVVEYAQWLLAERKKRADYPAKHLSTFISERGWEPFMERVA